MSVLYLLKRGVFVFFLKLVKSGKLLYLCDSAATTPLPLTVLPWWRIITFNFLCFKPERTNIYVLDRHPSPHSTTDCIPIRIELVIKGCKDSKAIVPSLYTTHMA
jgi:hypothetical protein